MNPGVFFTLLFVLSASLLIDCRHVTLAKPSTNLVNDNKQQTGRQTAEDRYDHEAAQEGLDSSELFDGLTLASYGYVERTQCKLISDIVEPWPVWII